MQALVPFLKWPGGKRWLAPAIVPVFQNELKHTYYEPFLGGGAVFLSLQPKRAVLADSNASLIECLKTIKQRPKSVLKLVWRWSNTRECYYRVRASEPRSAIGRAARFLYLNRTCWGGIYRLNRSGQFNVPFGDSGRTICSSANLLSAARAFKSATFKVADFAETFQAAASGDVIYADPPYTTRGAGNGFIRYNESLFHWQDQIRLAEVGQRAAKRGAFVAVSGLNHGEFLDLYPRWWVVEFERQSTVSYDIASRGIISEVVVFSRKPAASDSSLSTRLRRLP